MPGVTDFLDFNNPSFLGLLQGLGQAGMPSRTPVPFGAALGMGLQGMQQGQDVALQRQQNALREQVLRQQLQTGELERERYRADLAAQQRKAAYWQRLRTPEQIEKGRTALTPKSPKPPTVPLPDELGWSGDPAADLGAYDTQLAPEEETAFGRWKQTYAPNDSGADYDLRGAFKAGLTPAANGHWPDTFKKPNHPTFSDQSRYAPMAPERAGSWEGEQYIAPGAAPPRTQDDPNADIRGLVADLGEAGFDEAAIKLLVESRKAPTHDWHEVANPDGSTRFIDLNDPGVRQGAQRSAPQVSASPAGASAPAGFDAVYHGFVEKQEGGYTASDGNGAPANFGINQKANPDIDVKSLTPERAKQIYQERYWTPSGAESLPGPLQAVHFDTAVNMGVEASKRLLGQSGGDPQRYLQLREARYRAIAEADPSKASRLPNWLSRNKALGEYIGGAAPAAGGVPAAAPPSDGGIPGSAPKGERLATQEEKVAAKVDPNLPYRIAAGNKLTLPEGVKPTETFDLPAGTGLTPVGKGFFRNRTGQIFAINKSGIPQRVAGPTDEQESKSVTNITSLNELVMALHQFDKAAEKLTPKDFGPFGQYIGDQTKYATAKAASTNLMMLLKGPAAYNLGVLAGPDLDILQGVVADPAQLNTALRKGSIKPALTQLAKSLGTRYAQEQSSFKSMGGDTEGLPELWYPGRRNEQLMNEGRAAIKQGADRQKVMSRLLGMGINPKGL